MTDIEKLRICFDELGIKYYHNAKEGYLGVNATDGSGDAIEFRYDNQGKIKEIV